MWYSESHPSQKPTLISYDEFLKITYPAAEDVGAARGKRPKAVALHLHYSHIGDYNRHVNSELTLPLAGANRKQGRVWWQGIYQGGGGGEGKKQKQKLKKHSRRLLPLNPHSYTKTKTPGREAQGLREPRNPLRPRPRGSAAVRLHSHAPPSERHT